MNKAHLTNEESRMVFLKVMKARKRHNKYLRLKHIEKNKPKKRTVKSTPDTAPLHSGIAHQPSVIHPGGMTRWQRFWSRVKKFLHL